tara:strand:+ start:273 stop:452 length:180 start_codon:yes stop_codon:yes gene_type:complete
MKKINIIGSMGTILALGFIVYVNMPKEKICKDTQEPISQPVDMVMDSINMECGDSLQWE